MFTKFDRYGKVLQRSPNPFKPEEYPIFHFQEDRLSPKDEIVRKVENDFAASYDLVQFTTPGMRYVAEQDTALLEQWIGNPQGMRILEIGPGTGRTTLPLADAVGETGKVYAIDTACHYLEVMTQKAASAGIEPTRVKLGVGDIQIISFQQLWEFIEERPLDIVTFWFGPLALMPTDPKHVLSVCNNMLNADGVMLITTNSKDGLAYQVPETATARGSDCQLPLGYKPSIFTRRQLDKKGIPTGMILGTGQILPAVFYSPQRLIKLLEKTGLKLAGNQGISRLTGLYPACPENPKDIQNFISAIALYEPRAAKEMAVANDLQEVWEIAEWYDEAFACHPDKVFEYTYPAYMATKQKNIRPFYYGGYGPQPPTRGGHH